jgi:hypothetical protein
MSSKHPRSPFSVTMFQPRVPDRWRNEWPIFRTDRLPRPSISFVASWECSTFIEDFCCELLLLRHYYTTFSPAPESKALIPLPGRRNSTRPKPVTCHATGAPRANRATCTRHRRLHYSHGCHTTTTHGNLLHFSPRSSTQRSRSTARMIENSWLPTRP